MQCIDFFSINQVLCNYGCAIIPRQGIVTLFEYNSIREGMNVGPYRRSYINTDVYCSLIPFKMLPLIHTWSVFIVLTNTVF